MVIVLRAKAVADDHVVGSVDVYRDIAAAKAAAAPAGNEAPGISFLKEQQWTLDFGTAVVEQQTLRESIRVAARLEARPGGAADVAAPIDGRLLAVVGGAVGTRVGEGQELARLLPPPTAPGDLPQMQRALAEAQSALAQAVRDRERAERLTAAGAAPERRLEEARLAESQARLRVTAAESSLAQFNAARSGSSAQQDGLFVIRAPITGVIATREAVTGANVSAGTVLFQIVDPVSIHVVGHIPEADAGRARTVTSAEIEIAGQPDRVPVGKLVSLGRVLDPASRTLPITFTFDNTRLALPVGQTVVLYLLTNATTSSPVVPSAAVVDDAGRPIVFVQREGESFERRAVTVGIRSGGLVQVTDGLKPGERVVTKGAYWSVWPPCRRQYPRTGTCTKGEAIMIDRFIHWSLRHRTIVAALSAAFLMWGGWTAFHAPLDVLPDLTAPAVTILAEAPGMDPLEIESLVTFPIESALNGAAGVRRVRSATAVGVAVVWVEFDWGQDIARARQTVTEKLSLVSGSLPPSVEPPFLAPVSSIMGEVLFVDLESDTHSALEVRTVAETVVRRRLLAVPGVSQVIATGGEQKQYEVVLDPVLLASHEVTVDEVERALTAANQNATAGFQAAEGQEYLVRGVGRLTGLEAIGAVSVKSTGSVPVFVRDVGQVREGSAIKRGEGSHNAHPAVILGIQKQPSVNTLELTRRIERTLDDIQRSLPAGMQIHRDLFRQADFIEQSLGNLRSRLLEGAVLVTIVVLVFLMNVRAAAITLLALPLSMLAAVIAMDRFGLTLNVMSLGGLAIAIGELVDDAIINVENVVRRLREAAASGKGPSIFEIVYRASVEVRSSVVFATVIVAIVFVPLFLLGSVEGRLLKPLGFAYVVALSASLLVALTITPVLCYWFLPKSRHIASGTEPRLTQRVKAFYETGSNAR